jgi:hypothetical protein
MRGDFPEDFIRTSGKELFGQNPSDFLGKRSCAPLPPFDHALPVQAGDHSGKDQQLFLDLAEGGDRGHAAPAEASQECPLRRGRQPGLVMINPIDKRSNPLVVLLDFDRQRALSDGRQAHFGREALGNPVLQAKADEARSRQDDGVQAERFQFLEPRLHVAAEWNDLQVGAAMEELHLSSQATGPDPRTCRKFSEPKAVLGNERVERIFAPHDRAQAKASRQLRREILHAMDGQVDPAFKQGLLDLLHEEPLSTRLRKRRIKEPVT